MLHQASTEVFENGWVRDEVVTNALRALIGRQRPKLLKLRERGRFSINDICVLDGVPEHRTNLVGGSQRVDELLVLLACHGEVFTFSRDHFLRQRISVDDLCNEDSGGLLGLDCFAPRTRGLEAFPPGLHRRNCGDSPPVGDDRLRDLDAALDEDARHVGNELLSPGKCRRFCVVVDIDDLRLGLVLVLVGNEVRLALRALALAAVEVVVEPAVLGWPGVRSSSSHWNVPFISGIPMTSSVRRPSPGREVHVAQVPAPTVAGPSDELARFAVL
ncbi:hypothetical protein I601_3128 [Nocardioides dokdonensis FR1436]|uniref:Uncharacterized protein n=1 Tax=Nocardioides dokdonensis FR1436 TaxID=1300347 RepID=A0A1A9GQ19_9ACTN|nr:hypothetical protein I601_3128 [Nocardioides dokdonensis FR1436]